MAKPPTAVVNEFNDSLDQYDKAVTTALRDHFAVQKEFDPDEPRDELGQWTAAGGGAGAEVFLPPGGLQVYHGTSSKYLGEIKQQGLQSLRALTPNNDHLLGPRGESVFVTDDLGTAKGYARERAANDVVGGAETFTPVILEITLPPSARARKDPWVTRALMVKDGIPPAWITGVSTDGGNNWKKLNKARKWYAVIMLDEGAGKVFNPDQPRDDHGRWTAGGGDAPDGGIKNYLGITTKMGSKVDEFVLTHGQAYATDEKTFIGGPAQQCYKNAALAVIEGRFKEQDLTYVEGYVSVHGVPIAHAWTVTKDGKVRDVTIGSSKGIEGYFGVPIQTERLMQELVKNKVYGILTGQENYRAVSRLLAMDPKQVVA